MTTGKPSPASSPRPADRRPDGAPGCVPPHPAGDRLRAAFGLVVAAVGVVVACLLTVALDGIRGSAARTEVTAQLYRATGLNQLALTPAGRQGRRPDSIPTRIDGRFLPVLPQEDPAVLPLLEAGQLAAPRATAP